MAGYGMKGHVMVQFQNSFGASLTDSMVAIPQVTAGLVKTIEPIVEEANYARFDQPPSHQGKHTFAGDIDIQGHPVDMGWFMKSVIGYTSTTSAAASQSHIFKPRSSDFDGYALGDPMTIEQHLDVGSAGVFQSMIGNTLNLNMANGELMGLTAGFMGAGFTKKAAGSPVYATNNKPFKWDQSSVSWGGMSVLDVQDLVLSFNNNAEAFYTLVSTAVPTKIKRSTQRTIELNGTMIFQTHSFWDIYEAGTELPFILNFAGSQSPNALTLDMPQIYLKSFEPTNGGPGIIMAPFTADVKFHQGSSTALQVTLVNTYEGYLTPSLT
jgi:hypothetical protein